jgi:ribokinase
VNGRVAVLGSFMMDLVVRAERRPEAGETVIGDGFEMHLGGKGFNQAVAARRSGAATGMIGRLGDDDFGRRFLAVLEREGIDRSHVGIDEANPTGVGAPLVEPSGENSIVVVPLANSAITVDDVVAATALIGDSDVLLLQLELPLAAAVAAAEIARRHDVKVMLNPAPARPSADIVALRGLVDVLLPNQVEAAMLAGAHAAPERLAREWGCTVVMTAGRAGCVISDDGQTWSSPAYPTSAIDTVGAGDAFCGALAACLAEGVPLREAVRHANAAGALAVSTRGAEPSMPLRADIAALVYDDSSVDAIFG